MLRLGKKKKGENKEESSIALCGNSKRVLYDMVDAVFEVNNSLNVDVLLQFESSDSDSEMAADSVTRVCRTSCSRHLI